ncbi:hypothetical protein L486_00341 [Kwoniella mangroviensis CBS 10435]|uniref:UDP-glycosyltransferases domain-containing protein n=1 Tax=Kwoniella mangroviensis CBS 10435 TaxID=1331196 RepID=A0A1B9IYV8_9TREE|nr:hypothetical protein L486_00341 [Kwoniella mangroviensis CBS 10435]
MSSIQLEKANKAKHFLFVPHGIWGHLRPAINLIPNLLIRSTEALVTILVPVAHHHLASQEFEKHNLHDHNRVKVVYYETKEDGDEKRHAKTNLQGMMVFYNDIVKMLSENYEKILKSEPIHDAYLDKEVSTHLISPNVVSVEVQTTPYKIPMCEEISKKLGKEVKMALWSSVSGNYTAWAVCDLYEGRTYRDRVEKIFQVPEADRTKAYNEQLGENENVVHVPDNAPIYVFEAQPNQPDNFLNIVLGCLPVLPRVTMIHSWPSFLGQGYKKGAADLGIKVLQMGPQLPKSSIHETELVEGALKEFLDKALNETGENSVIYISFGTLLYSANLQQLSILLDVLITLDKRFILALGLASEEIQLMAKKKIDESDGKGIWLNWAPQYPILKHKATGWFLSHGGANSTMEAMRTGTPLLFWPADVDQVWIANQFSRIYKAGYEFLQVPNGPSIGRITYTGVKVHGTEQAIRDEFTDVFGKLDDDFGKELREGIRVLGDRMDNDPFTEEDWKAFVEL